MNGPPRKPIAVRLVEAGNKPRSRFVEREKNAPRGLAPLGKPPAHLSTEQRAIWVRVVSAAPAGLLTALDQDALVSYVALVDLRDRCLQEISAAGSTIVVHSERDKREQIAPALRELKRIVVQLHRMQAELGFTPLSRGRVQLVPPPDEPDALDRFLT